MNAQNSATRSFIHLSSLILVLFLFQACSTGTDSGTTNTKLFDSGNIAPDATFSYTFGEAGSFEYYCELHAPNMQGVVEVSADAEISGQDTVEMINSQFNPSNITVAPNTEIVWINRASEFHTVVHGNPDTDNDGIY